MSAIGIVTHHHRDQAIGQARSLVAWLRSGGHDVRVTAADADALGTDVEVHADADFAEGLDLVVSLGGDGSILRAIDLAADRPVPVLGVNLGELGYLAVVEPGEEQQAVQEFLADRHTIQERLMVQADVVRAGEAVEVHHALNDVVVERGATSTTIRLAVSIDGAYFHTYAGDGVIVASATGSTAYSLSARGPIVAPDLAALLMTPVSPHQLFDRSLVLGPRSVVTSEVVGHRDARLSVDGRTLTTLAHGDVVRCTASPRSAHLVTFGATSFHEVLKAKFGLDDRRR